MWKDAQQPYSREKSISTSSHHPPRLASLEKMGTIKCWWGWGEAGTLGHCWWEAPKVKQLWEKGLRDRENLRHKARLYSWVRTQEKGKATHTAATVHGCSKRDCSRQPQRASSSAALQVGTHKVWLIHVTGCSSGTEKNGHRDSSNTHEPPQLARWRQPAPQGRGLYDGAISQNRQIPREQTSGCLGLRGRRERPTCYWVPAFFWSWWECSGITGVLWPNLVNILNTTELYLFKWETVPCEFYLKKKLPVWFRTHSRLSPKKRTGKGLVPHCSERQTGNAYLLKIFFTDNGEIKTQITKHDGSWYL